MSRQLSGSNSGSSRSFGGFSSGGSRSFGGSSPNSSTRRLSGSSNSGSHHSSDDFSCGDSIGLFIDLLFIVYDIFGLPGVAILIVIGIAIYVGINYPVALGVIIAIGVVIIISLIIKSIVSPKRSVASNKHIIDIITDKHYKIYDRDIIFDDLFSIHAINELQNRGCLDKKGRLTEDKIEQAREEFDQIYKSYIKDHHYHLG